MVMVITGYFSIWDPTFDTHGVASDLSLVTGHGCGDPHHETSGRIGTYALYIPAIYLTCILTFSLSGIQPGIYSDILFVILSGIHSGIPSGG